MFAETSFIQQQVEPMMAPESAPLLMDEIEPLAFSFKKPVCDDPPLLTDFSAERYMGNWYEQQHVKGIKY